MPCNFRPPQKFENIPGIEYQSDDVIKLNLSNYGIRQDILKEKHLSGLLAKN